MKQDTYKISANNDNLIFVFNSLGNKGTITKFVVYEKIEEDIFNLAFGDFNPELGTIQDTINSKNGDGRKVLATVISTLDPFFKKHPKAEVFIIGSTLLRTKIYHRIIKKYYHQFDDIYEILGYKEENNNLSEKFDKGQNYVQFSILKKKQS